MGFYMAGIIAVGGIVIFGATGAVAGGIAASITHYMTKPKAPDESSCIVQTARRIEPFSQRLARGFGALSRDFGSILSVLGGAATGGAGMLSYYFNGKDYWIYDSYR